ncbi:MAG: glycosyltransferase family 39 protein [Actinomycetota bacterium]|nr:glycosyltransferase family 39 protein [Actinomycetota bacterium]
MDQNSRGIVLVALALNLIATTAYAIVLSDQLRYLDERDYVQLTRSMAEGSGFSTALGNATAFRPPGYPLMLLPAYLISGGSVLAMRMVGVLSLAGAIWLVSCLGRRAHSGAVGALAAVLMAGYPLLTYTATTLYPQVPALFLLLLCLHLSLQALSPQHLSHARRLSGAIIGGLAGGLLTVTVPTFGPFVLAILGWLVWRHRRAEHRRWIFHALVISLFAVALLPTAWCVRNAVQLHAFVPVSTNNGLNLLLGNSEKVTATSGAGGDISAYWQRGQELHLDEVELDRFSRDEALRWIATHPARAADLYAQKVVLNFSFRNELATPGQGSADKDFVSALTFYPVLGLALLRVLMLRTRPLHPVEKAALWLVIGHVLLLAVFFTRLRLRMPLDGLTILLAASAVVVGLRLWVDGSVQPSGGQSRRMVDHQSDIPT